MRFTKILLVCFGLVLLAGLGANRGSVAAGTANPALVADGGEPFPTPPGFADGGEPFPPKPPQASMGLKAAA